MDSRRNRAVVSFSLLSSPRSFQLVDPWHRMLATSNLVVQQSDSNDTSIQGEHVVLLWHTLGVFADAFRVVVGLINH